jgi:hypothetical protein
MSKSKEQFDTVESYCPMLGHALSFKYCRTMQMDLPCSRILDCWFERLPIQQYVGDHFTKEEQAQVFVPVKPKMVALADIVEKVKKESE